MSKFEALEMSQHVALHPRVEAQKFLGLFGQHYLYTPTRSRISSFSNYYDTNDGEAFLRISEASEEEICEQINRMGERQVTGQGEYRLDLCISADARFVAFQLYHRQRGEYQAVSIIRFLEGDTAQCFEQLLA